MTGSPRESGFADEKADWTGFRVAAGAEAVPALVSVPILGAALSATALMLGSVICMTCPGYLYPETIGLKHDLKKIRMSDQRAHVKSSPAIGLLVLVLRNRPWQRRGAVVGLELVVAIQAEYAADQKAAVHAVLFAYQDQPHVGVESYGFPHQKP